MAIIIGIAGGSASGKSTLTSKIAGLLSEEAGLRVDVISTDRYFLPNDRIPRFFSPTRKKEMANYNHPDSIDLAALLAELDGYRNGTGQADVLIVEGLMVLHYNEVRERLDLRIFIELDADQRALRRLVRNLGHQYDPLDGEHTAETIANYFLESAKVGHDQYIEPSRKHADLILRGDSNFDRTAPMTSAVIRSLL